MAADPIIWTILLVGKGPFTVRPVSAQERSSAWNAEPSDGSPCAIAVIKPGPPTWKLGKPMCVMSAWKLELPVFGGPM
jgi:hypothetical protein